MEVLGAKDYTHQEGGQAHRRRFGAAVGVERIEKLQKAVKYAREAANAVPAPDVRIGAKVFGYLFS